MRKKKKSKSQIFIVFYLAVMAFITLFPFYLMVVTSTKDQIGFIQNFWGVQLPVYFENYISAWEVIRVYALNSVKVTLFTVIGVLLVSVLAGYAFAKLKFKGRNLLFYLLMMFQMIPVTLILIPMLINVNALGMNDTHAGVILPQVATGCIMPIMLTRGYFYSIPDSIFEAARIDGAGELKIINSIVLPVSKPVLGSVCLFTFFSSFNSFMWPYIVLSSDELRTIPIGLNRLIGQYGTNFGFQMAAYAIVSIPLMLLILSTLRIYVEGMNLGAVKE
ncbi:MAG: carbohydrate ABC transporter permease [Clostridia bacterium]|nr:carbohydrate ABC transporter permease [Clostridia bacterium]